MLGLKLKLQSNPDGIIKATEQLSINNSEDTKEPLTVVEVDERHSHTLLTYFLDHNFFKSADKKEFVESTRYSLGLPTGLDNRKIGTRILRWINSACRPLTFRELSDGFYHCTSGVLDKDEIDPDARKPLTKEEIISLTFCLVDEIDGYVGFRYQSLRDRLRSRMLHYEKRNHKEMAIECIKYLLSFSSGACTDDVDLQRRWEGNPFFDYAASFWGRHVSHTVKHGRNYDADLYTAIMELLHNDQIREAVVQALYTSPHRLSNNRNRPGCMRFDEYPKSMMPVHLAAYFDLAPIVRYLLRINPKLSANEGNINSDLLNIPNGDMMTPLHVAAFAGASEVVRYLLGLKSRFTGNNLKALPTHMKRSKPLIDIDDVAETRVHDGGGTALCFAAGNGHYNVCQILLQHGASTVRAWPKTGWNPLVAASRGGHLKCIELLLGNGAIISVRTRKGRSALIEAVEAGHIDVVKLLLQHGAGAEMNVPTDLNMDTPLQSACGIDNSAMVEILSDDAVRHKLDVDGALLLRLVAEKGQLEVLKVLLDRKLVKGVDCGPAVYWAAYKGQERVIDLLVGCEDLDATTYTNFANGWTPLQTTAHKDNRTGGANIIRKLVAADVPIDAKSDDGETALHRAAERGHKLNICALLEAGANPNSRRKGGMTTLHIAVQSGSADIIEILLKEQSLVDLNVRDDKGRTLLHIAAEKPHLSTPAKALFSGSSRMRHEMVFANHEIVEMVALSSQAKLILDALDKKGNTALHTCAITGNAGVAQFLFKYGANTDLQNCDNITAKQLAEVNGFEKVVKALNGEMVEVIGYPWKRRADPKYTAGSRQNLAA